MLAFSVTEAPSTPPVPVDPCLSEPCGAFSECSSQEGEALCSCLPGYVGEPPSCGLRTTTVRSQRRNDQEGKILTLCGEIDSGG